MNSKNEQLKFWQSKKEILIPLILLLLCLIPMLGGTIRLSKVIGGVALQENARFLASPLATFSHIIGASLFSVLGAFQFAPGFRRQHLKLHRVMGRVLFVAGLVTSVTGLYMTLHFPQVEFDNSVVYWSRLFFGTMMTFSLIYSIVRVVRYRDIKGHGDWMIRAYAIGMGAAAHPFTHIPFFLIPSLHNETGRAIGMAGGWIVNWIIAEIIIGNIKLPKFNLNLSLERKSA
jgi:uncharacterized membrane protein